MFFLHLSNRTENLLARLVETLAVQPRRDLFAREYFLIQSQGMERMLSQRLADAFGVWCNFEYLLPTRFFEVMATRLGLEINPEAFGRDNLTWRLDALLQEIASEEQPAFTSPFAPLRHYMGGEQGDLKRFQLARQLANLFDQYQIMRPEILAGWQRQKTQTSEPAELWQMALWARLRDALPGVPHRGEMLHQFLERIQGDDDHAAILPTRLFLFGLHSMPPLLLACLHGISLHCDVHLCLLAPCRNYWADLPGKRQLIRENLRRLANSQEAQPLLPDVHPLLHSLARQGQDFQTMLLEQVDNLIDTDDFEDPADSSPGPPCLLHRLQSDLLDGGWGGHTGNAPLVPDDSLTIVSCHSAIREVMILKDQILRWLEKNPDMELRDILVMAPDIQDYAAIIPAIFHDIQHSIADRSQRGQNPYLAAFLQFLDLSGSRHTWSDVLDLLEKPEISRTFALDGPDLELIRHWVADAGIRWGLGPEQLHDLGLPSQTETTWHAGLERLLLGYAMDWNLPVNGVLPYPDIEGSQARPLGELCRFIALLTEAARDCLTSHPLSRWSTILLNLSVTLFGPDSSDDLARLRELLGSLHDRFGDLHHQPVPLEVVRSWLEASAAESKSSAGFLRGQLTFCSMLPMRSIPFAAICLLGLNDGAFPKNDRHPPFDLLGAEFRPGDRSSRGDDRYQFLEALLSARRYLFLSYIGQSIRSGHVIPPSVLISELVESLRLAYGIENPTQLHPLQPFSARYFQGSGLFSYDAHQCAVAQALRQPPLTSPSEPWWSGRLAEEPGQEARRRANVHDLLSFFAHPQRWFVTRQLDIQLAPRNLNPEEHEPFDLDGLTRYQISEELIQTTLSGLEAPEISLLRLQAEGRWPLAAPGRQRMEREQDALCDFARRIRAKDMGNKLPPLIIDLEWVGADGRTMHALDGQLDNLHENGILLARYATCKGKDLLRAWIHHLLAAAALPETAVTTHLLTSDLELTFLPCAAPLPLLEQLMAIFVDGCSRPSPLLVEAAWRYVRQQGKAQARTSPLQAATTYLQEKLDNGQEPELTLLYGEHQAATLLDPEFVALCEAVVAPIFLGGEMLP